MIMAHTFQSLLVLAMIMLLGGVVSALRNDFYRNSCPDVEKIVGKAIRKKFGETQVTAPALLQAYFHDCSNGCDASLLIAPTPANKNCERTHNDNKFIAPDAFDAINRAKAALEANSKCRGKVSCADIFTIATRDVIVLSKGPFYRVELGRLDSKFSKASNVRLPGPNMNVDQQLAIFKTMNLNLKDMVALLMAHSIGFAHCGKFSKRLYNFRNTGRTDPSYNPDYARDLKKTCPKKVNPNIVVRFDPITPNKLDNVYYKNLQNGLGLLTSDQALFQDGRSKFFVDDWATNVPRTVAAFKEAMIKLGRVKILTKSKGGVIRKHCDRNFNGQ